MNRQVIAVVLAGGLGTRLYPATRSDRPKQFQSFGGQDSLLTRTVDRLAFTDHTVIVTQQTFADQVSKHAPTAEVLVEPAPKDTGPALVYATHEIAHRFADPVLLCVPSDHFIAGNFERVARKVLAVAAETDALVTIGIQPTRPATGYGYIEPGSDHGGYFTVERFIEKPSAATAAGLVEAGYLWNSGMFAWTPPALLDAARTTPLGSLVRALENETPQRGFTDVDATSIDTAVLERSDNVVGVAGTFDWDDLGTWDAISRRYDQLDTESLHIDSTGVLVAGDHHVTTIGVDDVIVAAYDDRVLVVRKGHSERVREAVDTLKQSGNF